MHAGMQCCTAALRLNPLTKQLTGAAGGGRHQPGLGVGGAGAVRALQQSGQGPLFSDGQDLVVGDFRQNSYAGWVALAGGGLALLWRSSCCLDTDAAHTSDQCLV